MILFFLFFSVDIGCTCLCEVLKSKYSLEVLLSMDSLSSETITRYRIALASLRKKDKVEERLQDPNMELIQNESSSSCISTDLHSSQKIEVQVNVCIHSCFGQLLFPLLLRVCRLSFIES